MPTDERYIDVEISDHVATLTLNRPDKLNAWSWESARQLAGIADELRFNDDVRVVVLQANGRAFCAGVDLGMPEDRITGRSPAEKVRNYYEKFRWVHERFHVFSNLPCRPRDVVCLPLPQRRGPLGGRHPAHRRRDHVDPGPGGGAGHRTHLSWARSIQREPTHHGADQGRAQGIRPDPGIWRTLAPGGAPDHCGSGG